MKKKVLITGAAGFIGSHLTELCVEEGYDVTAFIHYNSKNSWGWLEQSEYEKDIKVVSGDVRDFDSVYSAVKGKDVIFHLAALIAIPYSYVSPLAYIKTNIEGTYNILQAARETEVSNILITSTSETYGTAQYIPIDESHPMVGQSPYAATKIGADHLAMSFYRSFDMPVKIVRPFNTFGPRQSARAIIPTVITQILSGERVLKLGNLKPTRDFTFVKDTAKGFLEIEKANSLWGEITNIGMNEEISVGDLVDMVADLLDVEIQVKCEEERVRPDKSEVERLYCDNTKILSSTQWKPAYSFKKGMAETIEWLKHNLQYYKPQIYNL